MQLMSDAVTVLGSRHGVFLVPCRRAAYMIRFGHFPGVPCEIRAGVRLGERELVFPLTSEGDLFAFMDQRISPTGAVLIGIDPETGIRAELRVTTPFKPGDARFSTTPVLDIRLSAGRLSGNFRWVKRREILERCELFLRIDSPHFSAADSLEQEIRWEFDAPRPTDRGRGPAPEAGGKHPIGQKDVLVVHSGTIEKGRIAVPFTQESVGDAHVHASWCTWSRPALDVRGEPAPFKYSEAYASLDDVAAWARDNPDAIEDNSRRVDGIIGRNNASRAVNNLLAQTLHSWLANTWWTTPSGFDRDWFTVWEGSCYYHSTVDVEYTQSPFYLTVWPELLGLQLDIWPHFAAGGEGVLGAGFEGTSVIMHDVGWLTDCGVTQYGHPMPVEENTNYVLMAYGYWKRTGDFGPLERNAGCIEKCLGFITRCDTTGNGVPDRGMANTIDDASPAVQFGKEQIYLAVKAMAAFRVGAEILEHAGRGAQCEEFRGRAEKILRVIRTRGWQGDHFATLLDASAQGVTDAWSGREYAGDVIPGWDAAHIYTANGLAILDMVGGDAGLDERLLRQDLTVATERCLDTYGCRHSDYTPRPEELSEGEGGTVHASRIGWVSMNILRDISALYRGLDVRWLADRYWEYQVVTNTQGPHLFFETFNGNNLMVYPRGVAVYGYFDALGGVRINRADRKTAIAPFDSQVRVPVLLLADWEKGSVPLIQGGQLVRMPEA